MTNMPYFKHLGGNKHEPNSKKQIKIIIHGFELQGPYRVKFISSGI